jgi:hypothetical protein
MVLPGRSDTSEFRMIEGQWTSESGEHVDVGAILATDIADARRVLGSVQARTRAAG